MGSNGAENAAIPCNDEGNCSETTVEIKIKTLDSQTYTLRVDKCVPVPALKEQIATVTGVLVEQQRLICRGKLLRDDQLLSAYHVEDGHTLHMIVRQPVPPSAENTSSHPESDPASSSGHSPGSRMGTSVLVGSFNISEQGDGMPDLGRIVSAVLNSIGITSGGNGSEELNLNELVRERGSNTFTLGGLRNSIGQQPDQAGLRDHQSVPNSSNSSHPTGVPLESLQPAVIPDSLTTLSQYLTHLRQEFDATVRGLNSISQAVEPRGVGEDIHAAPRASGPAGLPTPAFLGEVVASTRQLLNEQTAESLSLLAGQLENQVNVMDTSQRVRIQTQALRSGALLQNLGALLLELGRTMMTLRMGQTAGDAIVNAGPAIFVSPTGPNPIMVQPSPFQPGTGLGGIPVGTVQHGSGSAVGSIPSGFIPRNIDIRIRTARDRRDLSSSQHQTQTVPPVSSTQQTTAEGTGPSSAREPEVRAVPLRNLLSTPAPIANATASDSSARSMGILFPVITRVHHVTSRNPNNTRASQVSDHHHARNVENGRSSMPNSTAHPENVGTPGLDAAGASIGQEFSAQIHDGLNQFLRNFMSEHTHSENVGFETMGTPSVEGHTEVAQEANGSQQATPPVSEEGLLVSNMLREIMPLISESIGTTSHSSAADGENSTQGPTNPEQGQPSRRRSSRQRRDPTPQQSPPKRHKRE